MITVTVWSDNIRFRNEISNALKHENNITIDNNCLSPDILIMQKNKSNVSVKANILIMLNDKLFDNVDAQIAISCGVSDKNTLTLSSSETGQEMASLQREILSINGKILEPREIDLSNVKGNADEKMLMGALKLVLEKDS